MHYEPHIKRYPSISKKLPWAADVIERTPGKPGKHINIGWYETKAKAYKALNEVLCHVG